MDPLKLSKCQPLTLAVGGETDGGVIYFPEVYQQIYNSLLNDGLGLTSSEEMEDAVEKCSKEVLYQLPQTAIDKMRVEAKEIEEKLKESVERMKSVLGLLKKIESTRRDGEWDYKMEVLENQLKHFVKIARERVAVYKKLLNFRSTIVEMFPEYLKSKAIQAVDIFQGDLVAEEISFSERLDWKKFVPKNILRSSVASVAEEDEEDTLNRIFR